MDLTHDELDAVLRDPQVPSDVRAAVQTEMSLRTYLNSVTFSADDTGFTTVSHKDLADIGPVSQAPPSGGGTAATAGSEVTIEDVSHAVAETVLPDLQQRVDAALDSALSDVHAKVDEAQQRVDSALSDVHAKVDEALATPAPDSPPPAPDSPPPAA